MILMGLGSSRLAFGLPRSGRGCKQRMRQPGMAKRQQVTVDLTVGSNGEAPRRRGKELSDGN
jgi:hypothetical protein